MNLEGKGIVEKIEYSQFFNIRFLFSISLYQKMEEKSRKILSISYFLSKTYAFCIRLKKKIKGGIKK
ncbi:MAG: hypothetical protein AB1414_00060 [bacterium]